MIEAVLFDWNDTLVQFTWDDETLVEGHQAAFAAIGRTEDVSSFSERYRRLLFAPESRNRPYAVLLRELVGGLTDDEVDRFIDAEHGCWLSATPAARLGPRHAGVVARARTQDSSGDERLAGARLASFVQTSSGSGSQRCSMSGLLDRRSACGNRMPEIFLRALERAGRRPARCHVRR